VRRGPVVYSLLKIWLCDRARTRDLYRDRRNGWLPERPKERLAMFTAPLSNRRPLSIKPLPISGKVCILRRKKTAGNLK
jgi:hypothetical protein